MNAIIFGASGLVGSYLLNILLIDEAYEKIVLLTRRKLNISHEKIIEFDIDFDKPDEYKKLIKGDVVFCCLGTTVKNAGSQIATRKVDLDYPVQIATIAKEKGIKSFIVISSLGANSSSRNFYLQSKGLMEDEISGLGFENFYSLRPSLLLGKRNEFRFAELIGSIFMKALSPLCVGKLKRYRAIDAQQVAKAMAYLSKNDYPETIIQSEKIKILASK